MPVKSPVSTSNAFLFNVTRKTLLSQDGKVLRGLSTAKGAMFSGLPGSLVLVWWREGRIAITNWFVPEALDIVWVSAAWKVVHIRESFPAGAWKTVNDAPAMYVVELPAGTVSKTKTRVGDTIRCRDFAK